MILETDVYQTIAAEENAIITITEKEFWQGTYKSFYKLIHLSVPYKDEHIVIENSVQSQAFGKSFCELTVTNPDVAFTLTTRSHFDALLFGGNRLKIRTKSTKIKNYLKHSVALNKLKKVATDTRFEPTITGYYNTTFFVLKMEYNLDFENKHQVISPIIAFYKEFIDNFTE